MSDLKPVNSIRAKLAEGPCWDERNQLLYWVDILNKEVHIYDPCSQTDREIDVGQLVGAVVLRKNGGAVVALERGFWFLDTDSGKLVPAATDVENIEGNRFNDGKCDAAGRFFAGSCTLPKHEPFSSLYCLEPDCSVRKVFGNVTISNGISWSPDNRTMYYIDTPARVVMAYDYDLGNGSVTNGRIAVRIPENGGGPDGMTTDEQGMLWVAQWDGWQVSRWDPNSGRMLESIPLPVARVSSCIFGGPQMDELYITTAKPEPWDTEALENQPYAGGIFRVKVNTRGLPSYRFNG